MKRPKSTLASLKSDGVFSSRRHRLLQSLKSNSFDALLVSDSANVHYLSGFRGDDSWLLVSPSDTILITDSRFIDQVEIDCPGLHFDVRKPGAAETMTTQAARLIESTKLRSIAFERSNLTVAILEAINEKLKSASLIGADSLVEDLRVVKDDSEIDAIRLAVESAERAFAVVKPSIQPADTEKAIADRLDAALRTFGGDASAFETIVAVGPRAALPHARPTLQKCEESPIVLVDWGVRRNLYNSDLTRTLHVGKPTARFARVYDAVLGAQLAAIEAIRPGARTEDVDRIARSSIGNAGFGRYFGHGLGHGIGLRVHEAPRLRPRVPDVLRPGMVVTVEPGIYLKNWGGIRIEDDILVTRSGREVLSSVPKQLDEIII